MVHTSSEHQSDPPAYGREWSRPGLTRTPTTKAIPNHQESYPKQILQPPLEIAFISGLVGHKSVIRALRKSKQGDHEFKGSLSYIGCPCLKKKKEKKRKERKKNKKKRKEMKNK